jgi:hypothetical protein
VSDYQEVAVLIFSHPLRITALGRAAATADDQIGGEPAFKTVVSGLVTASVSTNVHMLPSDAW